MVSEKITVIGAGYVGLTTAVLLANSGFKVFLLENDQERLKALEKGRSFFYEAGLNELVAPVVESGKLIPTDSYQASITKSDFVFSCVGTPDNPDGSSNLNHVFSAAEEAAKYMASGSIYVQKSTVPVGTGQKIEKLFKSLGKSFHYVSNPEFLREGTAISDSLFFDRTVVGGSNSEALRKVEDLYKKVEEKRNTIAHISGMPVLEKAAPTYKPA